MTNRAKKMIRISRSPVFPILVLLTTSASAANTFTQWRPVPSSADAMSAFPRVAQVHPHGTSRPAQHFIRAQQPAAPEAQAMQSDQGSRLTRPGRSMTQLGQSAQSVQLAQFMPTPFASTEHFGQAVPARQAQSRNMPMFARQFAWRPVQGRRIPINARNHWRQQDWKSPQPVRRQQELASRHMPAAPHQVWRPVAYRSAVSAEPVQQNLYAFQAPQSANHPYAMYPGFYPSQGMQSPDMRYRNPSYNRYSGPQYGYHQPGPAAYPPVNMGWMPVQMMRPFVPFIERRQPQMQQASYMGGQSPWRGYPPVRRQQRVAPIYTVEEYQHGSVIHPIDFSTGDGTAANFVPHYSREFKRDDLVLCDFCVRG